MKCTCVAIYAREAIVMEKDDVKELLDWWNE